MAKIATATFSGDSGKEYSFDVYPADTSFKDISAVYIFTKRIEENGKGSHTFLYVGESAALGTRISSHEKWNCVNRRECNCICIHTIEGEKARLKVETDLRSRHSTPCNDQ